MGKRLTTYIMIALVLGLVCGLVLNTAIGDGGATSQARLETLAGYFSIVTTVFLRLIKMIIAPLVFATLVSGIAQMGDTAALGRIGARSIGWFICASLLSLTLGLVLVNIFQPGVGVNLPLPPATAGTGLETSAFNLKDFISHIFPTSMVDAMAKNEILQIVIFSLFVGVAITAVGEKAKPLVGAIDALVHVMLQITDYVMRFAPFAVFAAVAGTLTERGPKVIGQLAYFMGTFYLSMLILWLVLLGIGFIFIGGRIRELVRYVREPLLVAFSTASSEAAYPRMLEALDRFGVPPRVASFVLPLGYSFNLDGSMIYMGFASLFVAQAYGIHLPIATQITMLLVLMVTSKGIAGVPRASLVVIAATMPMFNIPEAGLLLILAVDHFLDMGRSATNVVGNAVASAVVAKWEGGFDPPEPIDIEPPHAPHGHGPARDVDSFKEL
ncbi:MULTISPECIES: dicarboxylate/amino acid:cation symporter [unclassified Sphingomonas]|uniref:dicarboxylate/amino acid:cation symporter n=1 Tax=unclassified Sphingomonas TaxID=196159 RepID=UPI000926C327|nr:MULTISPECIES: dicarboxylate/amino acid:cation symporter [unclassified Sphingomonas]MBN8847244.1 dicarboxylate/amino acid:cation symporter [Sphingomonas sp.]OJV33943.1 MAG: dicarboxylate/amino acid:cation symporter [Sphingomonas sp. 67-36]